MSEATPVTVICRYDVIPGKEQEMEELLAKHWPALDSVGLVSDEPPQFFRGKASAKPGGAHGAESTYVEIFSWKSADSPGLAHQTPEVMAVWEPMGAICKHMDFPSFDVLDLASANG